MSDYFQDPPHTVHQLIYEQANKGYRAVIIIKVYSRDWIELDDFYIEPIVKGAEWKNKKRRGLRLSEDDKQMEAQRPYIAAESIE